MHDEANKLVEKTREKLVDIKARLNQNRESITNSRAACDRFQERIRVKCVEQVRERHMVGELHNKDGIRRVQALLELLFGYEQDYEKILRTSWLLPRKEAVEALKKNIIALLEEANALNTSFSGIKLVYA